MVKRSRDDADEANTFIRASKRARPNKPDRLSILSDELILRALSFLPLPDLTLCERLSHRLKSLATDSQLWKSLYYDRFVRPRASRIPSLRNQGVCRGALHYASRISKWLDDEKLVSNGTLTDWKKQYKLRHNWSRGSAKVKETEVAKRPSSPPLLVRLHEDVIVIADQEHGLRAWSLKNDHHLIASHHLRDSSNKPIAPTSLAIDSSKISEACFLIVLGFHDGSFSAYTMHQGRKCFKHRYSHPASSTGNITAIACSSPFLLTMTLEPRLSLYYFGSDAAKKGSMEPPRLLSSLKSHTAYPPISLDIRTSGSSVVASIAFAMPSYMPKWTVGIQELRLSAGGEILDSRVAFAAQPQQKSFTNPAHVDMLGVLPLPSSRPASLSYNHPYLLTAHPDNTLALYMVTSTSLELDISPATILWGHTSSISSAHVGDRGKAVSISTRGNELRVWELEGRGSNNGGATMRHRYPSAQSSVRVQPEMNDLYQNQEGVPRPISTVNEIAKGWIAFDEEKVVLLREKMQGQQAVVVYDFT